jgi:hypothetical protein
MRYVVLLDQNRAPIEVEVCETATLTECNELERLPGVTAGVWPSGKADGIFDEPAHGRAFPCRAVFELVEELFVDRDRCSHDASG